MDVPNGIANITVTTCSLIPKETHDKLDDYRKSLTEDKKKEGGDKYVEFTFECNSFALKTTSLLFGLLALLF